MNTDRIPRRILGSLLSSLSAGVVPRSGAPYIAIGRNDEISALTGDLNRVADGEGVTRFIIGRYGSGKSFLIQLLRGYAIDKGFVTADCDLSPERRLCGSGGSGLATYRELIRNISCKASPDGGALPAIIGRWYSQIASELAGAGITPDDASFAPNVTSRIIKESKELESEVGGFDFALIVSEYCRAYGEGDDMKMSACLKWLRGEYGTKTEARRETGLPSVSIIDDSNWYEHIKLLCALVRKVGFTGMCVFIDEGVNLYKIVSRVSRESNYEKILSMFNDTMQGRASGLMLVFGGTPQFLEDTRRGLFSYEALRSRLCDSRFMTAGLKSTMGPVIRLRRLGDSELMALMIRLTSLHGQYYGWTPRITDEEKHDFLTLLLNRAGADTMITPREIIRDYVTLLDLLYQNPDKSYDGIMAANSPEAERKTDNAKRNHFTGNEDKNVEKNNGMTQGQNRPKITIDDIQF